MLNKTFPSWAGGKSYQGIIFHYCVFCNINFANFRQELEYKVDKIKATHYAFIVNERNWGGKRRGAGRKKGSVTYTTFSVVLPEEEVALLKKIAGRQNKTVSRFISEYLQLDVAAEIEKNAEMHNLK